MRDKEGKNMAENSKLPAKTEFLLYTSEDGRKKIQTKIYKETVWLTQKRLA
jgi:hypothetical protein